MSTPTIAVALERDIEHLHQQYALHFAGLPRANRCANRMSEMVARARSLVEIAGASGGTGVRQRVRDVYRFLGAELAEIRKASTDPTQVLVADAVMSGQLVEHRLRRYQAWNQPVPDPDQQATLAREAGVVRSVAHEIAPFVPRERGLRWCAEADQLTDEAAAALGTATDALSLLAEAPPLQRQRAVEAMVPVLERHRRVAEIVAREPLAFRVGLATRCANAVARCEELAPGHRTSWLRERLDTWLRVSARQCPLINRASNDHRLARVVASVEPQVEAAGVALANRDLAELELRLDVMVELHRSADAILGPDFVPSLDPGFGRMRDVMLAAERTLAVRH